MCGIVALVGWPRSEERTLRLHAMADSIAHRGPDSKGFFESASIGFGFRRLAILDLSSAGNQPMSTADGSVTVVFNGEIYNFLELRTELESLGHTFHSHSDTEVLLHSYIEWGRKCVERFNGMWAFLIFDRGAGKVVGSRDRFGIKPLYAARSGDRWVLASEIKALFSSGLVSSDPDWSTIADYFALDQIDHTESTFFEGVRLVPPATWFEIGLDGRYEEHTYWRVPEDGSREDVSNAPERFAELFQDAIRLHRRSDVPLAVHLSGGLDSTSILCALARSQEGEGKPLSALAFLSAEFDETRYISDTVGRTHAELHRLTSTVNQLWDLFPDALAFHDEPFHTLTAVVSYALMQETRRLGIKVVLNGQGADETLAGYGSYFEGYWHELLRSGRVSRALREIGGYARAQERHAASILMRQLRFTLQTMAGRALHRRRGCPQPPVLPPRHWASQELVRKARPRIPENWDVGLKGRLKSSIKHVPLPLYLRVEDRNSMAHSVESRVPFLDHRLVEFAFALPSDELLHDGWNKWLLRRAMKRRIPESVRMRRDKMGFPVPTAAWLRGPLWDALQESLQDDVVRKSGILNTRLMDEEVASFRAGDDGPAHRLFAVVQFSMWWRGVLKRNYAQCVSR